ncbi:WD repeat-containing protein jip5 [Entomophthora muscae]|uniref:WD repeat-containing protein jip5 n=1 Tax=Entomophthora muscae TaxID=34485 RepID=A0ACC2UHF1_9FUNG|nr:WD repeat-containing protein jip5 [Entomophthora muscae]
MKKKIVKVTKVKNESEISASDDSDVDSEAESERTAGTPMSSDREGSIASSPGVEFDLSLKIPNTIRFRSQVFDIAFHPTRPLILSGLITGDVYCHSYLADAAGTVEASEEYYLRRFHKKSCRGVKFNAEGNHFYTISKDKAYTICDTETGKELYRHIDAHESGLNALLPLTPGFLATGDEEGVVKIWDIRTNKKCIEYNEHEDFVASMVLGTDDKTLISVGGDGYLAVMDTRREKLIARSDNIEDELLSITLVKDGKKAVVGTQKGVLDLFTWGNWGDLSDRFLGHPESVDAIVKFDEDTIITGSSDGILRVVGILPNNLLGVLGHHDDFPIERLAITNDRHHVASCSHDKTIKFWPIHELLGEDSDEDEDEPAVPSKRGAENIQESEDSDSDDSSKKSKDPLKEKAKRVKKAASTSVHSASFFDDL